MQTEATIFQAQLSLHAAKPNPNPNPNHNPKVCKVYIILNHFGKVYIILNHFEHRWNTGLQTPWSFLSFRPSMV